MDNALVLRPLYLIPQYKVSVNEDNRTLDCPAQVDYTSATDSYEISFNPALALKMYEASALKQFITFDDLMAGLAYHEVFHIEFGSFSVPFVINNDFFHYVHNVICDNQIEYHGTRDHPECAKYIRYVLATLRKDADFSNLKKVANLQKQKDAEDLEKMKEAFYFLVRFGVIIKDADPEFVRFLIPIVLSAQRNEPKNLMDAAQAVYEYFHHIAKEKDIDLSQVKIRTRSINMREMKAIDKILADGETIIVSGTKKTIEAFKNQNPTKITIVDSQGAGNDKTRVLVHETDSHFYRSTVQKHEAKIKQIRNAFKRRLDAISAVPAYDGDLNWKRQQQAYVDSYTFEQGKNYQFYKKNRISLYNLVMRDISSSTSAWKDEYAELTVCLHAALQGLNGVADAHIDFNWNGQLLMNFGDPIREAAIYPVALGGTQFDGGFKIALEQMRWRGKKNIINVITDGDSMSGYEESEARLLSMGIKIWYWDVSPYPRMNTKLRKTSFSTFDRDIAEALLKEL
jgi:hypothetical protein